MKYLIIDNMRYDDDFFSFFFSEFKAVIKCFEIIAVLEIALILKYSHEQCKLASGNFIA